MAHTVEIIAVGVPLRAYLVFTLLEPCVWATIYGSLRYPTLETSGYREEDIGQILRTLSP